MSKNKKQNKKHPQAIRVIMSGGKGYYYTPKLTFNGKGIRWFDDSKLVKKDIKAEG